MVAARIEGEFAQEQTGQANNTHMVTGDGEADGLVFMGGADLNVTTLTEVAEGDAT